MADPAPKQGLPEAEFIELFNRSKTKSFNLKRFKIVNGSISSPLLRDTVLKPLSYIVIYAKKQGVDFKIKDTIQVEKLGTLSNPSDAFYLASLNGDTIIDAVSYDLSFYQNSNKAKGGYSLERARFNAPCDSSLWIASNDSTGGTPGRRNSVAVDSFDKMPPLVQRYYMKDSQTVIVVFNKNLNRDSAEDTKHYQILGINTNYSVKVFPSFFNTIQLRFNTALKPRSSYKLVIKPFLKDCQNQPLPLSIPDTLDIRLPEKPLYKDLIINEILVNPETGGSRFVEFYNRSDKAIDIGGLRIMDAKTSDEKTILTNFLLLPEKYIALTDNPLYIQKRYKAENFKFSILKNKLPTWNEAAGNVTLRAFDGTKPIILDSFSYEKSWHSPFLATTEGVSLERIDTSKSISSSEPSNWQSAAEKRGFGTPAQVNSQFRHFEKDPSVSSPFWLEKNSFSPDDDGFEDALLLHYKLDKKGGVADIQIFDSNGRLIKTLTVNELLGTEGVIRWQGERADGTKAAVGIYILHISMRSSNGTTSRQKLPCALVTQF